MRRVRYALDVSQIGDDDVRAVAQELTRLQEELPHLPLVNQVNALSEEVEKVAERVSQARFVIEGVVNKTTEQVNTLTNALIAYQAATARDTEGAKRYRETLVKLARSTLKALTAVTRELGGTTMKTGARVYRVARSLVLAEDKDWSAHVEEQLAQVEPAAGRAQVILDESASYVQDIQELTHALGVPEVSATQGEVVDGPAVPEPTSADLPAASPAHAQVPSQEQLEAPETKKENNDDDVREREEKA